jgi:hypothetical protein
MNYVSLVCKICYTCMIRDKVYEPVTSREFQGIVRQFEFGGVTKLIRSGLINGKFFNFNDKVSREEHKDFWDALSNQIDLPAFISPRKVNLKISLTQKITYL